MMISGGCEWLIMVIKLGGIFFCLSLASLLTTVPPNAIYFEQKICAGVKRRGHFSPCLYALI